VLVGDIVGDDENAVARATSEVIRLANGRSGEGFVAVSADARKKFWLDRKRTAAISKHTNAFKVNEDCGDPAGAHGRVHAGHRAHQSSNSACATSSRWSIGWRRSSRRAGCRWARPTDASEIPSAELLGDRVQQALARIRVGARAVAAVVKTASTPSSRAWTAPRVAASSTRSRTAACAHRGRRSSSSPSSSRSSLAAPSCR